MVLFCPYVMTYLEEFKKYNHTDYQRSYVPICLLKKTKLATSQPLHWVYIKFIRDIHTFIHGDIMQII